MPGRDDDGRREAPAREREAAPRRPWKRLAVSAAVGALGGAMFGVALLIAAARTDDGTDTVVFPDVNEDVRYGFHANPASAEGAVGGVSMLAVHLVSDGGQRLTTVASARRERSGAETDLTFDLRVMDERGAPVEGAVVTGEVLALPWMDRWEPSAATGPDGRAAFVFPNLTRVGSYQLRITSVWLDGERFVPLPGQSPVSVPVPGAD
ncbi:MAG TPA: hypothetical protein VNM43_01375 [Dehalococcoidia bacterium]|nr:hypothetical protein [Dehalococcoidia bacterium]